jgi:hypothetical protein
LDVRGNVKVSGTLEVEGVIRGPLHMTPRGDIDMGPFTATPPPPTFP